MKSLTLILAGVIGILGLTSAFAFITSKEQVSPKHLELVLRDIGHRLLLQAGDSTSRVLPVKKTDENSYQISFGNNLALMPDSIINLVYRHFEKLELAEKYNLSVLSCAKRETVFAYEINMEAGNLIPCGGRKLPMGCYLIEVEFLKNSSFNYSWLLLSLIPVAIAALIFFPRNSKKAAMAENKPDSGFLPVGRFKFYTEKNLLLFEDKSVLLSDKEGKALKIFTANINQVVERETLMNQIWENEGVVVISRNVDVLVSKLRKKLSDDETIKIINVHARGYKLSINNL